MFTRLLLVGALALLFAVTGRIKPAGSNLVPASERVL
jgi:hypothetical protein